MTSSTTAAEDPFAILGETLETAASALDVPTAHARESAHRAAATTKRVVGSGVYSLSYAVAYGAVFAATYVHDLLPDSSAVQRGLSDGTHDALASRSRRNALKPDAPSRSSPQAASTVPDEAADRAQGLDEASPRDTYGSNEARQRVDALAGRFDGEA